MRHGPNDSSRQANKQCMILDCWRQALCSPHRISYLEHIKIHPYKQGSGPGGLFFDSNMYSAPLSLLQLPPASLPEVSRKLSQPGNTVARFSQDGKSLNDLRGNVSEADLQQASECESDVGFVCKKCQMVYPAEILCANHQRSSCYAKNPAEAAKSLLKLVQVHVECKVCREKFSTVLDFKFHCDMDRHVKRVQKLKRIEDNAQIKKANGQQQAALQNQLAQQQQLRQLHQMQLAQLQQQRVSNQQRKNSPNVTLSSAADMLSELANAETASHVAPARLHFNNVMTANRGCLRLPNANSQRQRPTCPNNNNNNVNNVNTTMAVTSTSTSNGGGEALRVFADTLQRQREFRDDLEATLSRLNAAAALDNVLANTPKPNAADNSLHEQPPKPMTPVTSMALCFSNDNKNIP